MKTNIQIFENEMFGKIRTLTNEKGETFFVGKDVAKALGYSKPENAIATHVDSDDKTTTPIQGSGSNYKTRAIVINESGLYSLILSSKLDRAREFKHWVTSEVLPQIRMTGGYIPTKDTDGRQLTDAEIVDRAHDIIGRTLELVNNQNADCLTATQASLLRRCRAVQSSIVVVSCGFYGDRHRHTGAYRGRWGECPLPSTLG